MGQIANMVSATKRSRSPVRAMLFVAIDKVIQMRRLDEDQLERPPVPASPS